MRTFKEERISGGRSGRLEECKYRVEVQGEGGLASSGVDG